MTQVPLPIVGEVSVPRSVDLRIWLADLTYTQQTIAADFMPMAIGGIATFAETRVALPERIRLFKYPETLAAALERDGMPDVIGFSNYMWNSDLARQFARLIKRQSPDTVIVFGGPNYPVAADEQAGFLRSRPEIDFYVVKEGELGFAELITALWDAGRDVEAVKGKIASVHALARDGSACLTPTIARLTDLSVIPSPYVNGRLDEFFDGRLFPIIQTNRGCPFTCTFCVEGVQYYNKVYRNSAEKVAAEIDYIGARMVDVRRKGGRNDLFIADSNFGMYKDDLETCRQIARAQQLYGWPEYINVATGKNRKERVLEASRLINGALRLSGSVQSLDQEVLKNVKRDNISVEGLMELALNASEIGANSYSEIILALPGDTKTAHHRTIRTMMDAGFTNVILYQAMVLPGTDMGTEETKQQFGMQLRYRALPRCYGQYEVLGEQLKAAEIEEICVANSTLPLGDYLDCRMLHLVITIFHNDGIFGALLKLLRGRGVSVYRWMEVMRDSPKPGRLDDVFAAFRAATQAELWDTREMLETFIREPGNMERFLNGELGNNLLFFHKARAITECLDDLVTLARGTIRQVLAESGEDTPEHRAFVEDALSYQRLRMANIFTSQDADVRGVLRYDIPAFEAARKPDAVAPYRFPQPAEFRFLLDGAQRRVLDRYVALYGDSTVGISRILSKVYVKKLLRRPANGDAVFPEGELTAYQISGLQA